MTDDKNEFALPWTGERFVPSLQGPIYYEHLHRYALALELVVDRTCLDIACGEGFGSSLLARKAKFVWGVDLDEACVNHARKKYVRNNLKFLAGSATKIPLEDHSIDVVVSFETIEHFGEHHAFMREIIRVLTPDGIDDAIAWAGRELRTRHAPVALVVPRLSYGRGRTRVEFQHPRVESDDEYERFRRQSTRAPEPGRLFECSAPCAADVAQFRDCDQQRL